VGKIWKQYCLTSAVYIAYLFYPMIDIKKNCEKILLNENKFHFSINTSFKDEYKTWTIYLMRKYIIWFSMGNEFAYIKLIAYFWKLSHVTQNIMIWKQCCLTSAVYIAYLFYPMIDIKKNCEKIRLNENKFHFSINTLTITKKLHVLKDLEIIWLLSILTLSVLDSGKSTFL
jgi:hypothetical protein